MKKLLVFVFAVALLGSCSKRKTVQFETLILSNTNHTHLTVGGDKGTRAEGYTMSFRGGPTQYVDTMPIAVGERDTSFRNPYAEEGDNIRFRLWGKCDSTFTTIDSIQCDFEILIGFFVDDVLIEERNISHSYSEINNGIGFLENEYYSENTIDFTVP